MFGFIIKIFGCQVNYYDAQKITEALTASGGKEVKKPRNADLIVILACSVRQKAVDKLLGHIRNWRRLKKQPKIIVVGCVLNPDKKKIKVNWLGSTENFLAEYFNILRNVGVTTNIVRACREPSLQQVARRTSPPECRYAPSESKNKRFQDRGEATGRVHQTDSKTGAVYLPITSGCNNFCSFCAVPYTRGRETSQPLRDILRETQSIVDAGHNYIMLLGQNVNSYGCGVILGPLKSGRRISTRSFANAQDDIGKCLNHNWTKDSPSPFVRLLMELEKIKGLKKIGFLSPNPQDIGNDLIWWLNTSKKFDGNLHLPLQSGSDKILKMMNRQYTSGQYLALISKLKSQISNPYLSTDIIVGFPGETKKDFEDTVKLYKKLKFKKAYIAQYSPRPGTLAAKKYADNVPAKEKNRRFHLLDQLING